MLHHKKSRGGKTMKGKRSYLVAGVIAMAVAFVTTSHAADFGTAGTYYPAVSPNISGKVDTKAGSERKTDVATYHPAVSPNISAKVDTKSTGRSASDATSAYYPKVSPKL